MLRCIFYIVYAIVPKNILVFNTLIFHAIGCIMYVIYSTTIGCIMYVIYSTTIGCIMYVIYILPL